MGQSPITTPTATANFVFLAEGRPNDRNQIEYSMCLIWPKNTDLSALKKAFDAAGKEKFGDKWAMVQKASSFRNIFHDGDIDKMGRDEYKNSIYLNCKSRFPVGCCQYMKDPVTGQMENLVIDPSEVYSGCKVQVGLSFNGYDSNGNKGVSAGLAGVRKVAEGERLDGGVRDVTALFDGVDVDLPF